MGILSTIRGKLRGGKRPNTRQLKNGSLSQFCGFRTSLDSNDKTSSPRKGFEMRQSTSFSSGGDCAVIGVTGESRDTAEIPSNNSTAPRAMALTISMDDADAEGRKHTRRCFEAIYYMLFSRCSADSFLRQAVTGAIVDQLLLGQKVLEPNATNFGCSNAVVDFFAVEVCSSAIGTAETQTSPSASDLTIYSGLINTWSDNLCSNVNNVNINNTPKELIPVSTTRSNFAPTTTGTELDQGLVGRSATLESSSDQFQSGRSRMLRSQIVRRGSRWQPRRRAIQSAGISRTIIRTATTASSNSSTSGTTSASQFKSRSFCTHCSQRSCSTEQQGNSQTNSRRDNLQTDEGKDKAASDSEYRRRERKSRQSSTQRQRQERQKERPRNVNRESPLSVDSDSSPGTQLSSDEEAVGTKNNLLSDRNYIAKHKSRGQRKSLGSRDSSVEDRRESERNLRLDAVRKSWRRQRNSEEDDWSQTGSQLRDEAEVKRSQIKHKRQPSDQYQYQSQSQVNPIPLQQQEVPLPRAWRAFSDSSSNEETVEECNLCELVGMHGAAWRLSSATAIDPHRTGSFRRTLSPGKKRRHRHCRRRSRENPEKHAVQQPVQTMPMHIPIQPAPARCCRVIDIKIDRCHNKDVCTCCCKADTYCKPDPCCTSEPCCKLDPCGQCSCLAPRPSAEQVVYKAHCVLSGGVRGTGICGGAAALNFDCCSCCCLSGGGGDAGSLSFSSRQSREIRRSHSGSSRQRHRHDSSTAWRCRDGQSHSTCNSRHSVCQYESKSRRRCRHDSSQRCCCCKCCLEKVDAGPDYLLSGWKSTDGGRKSRGNRGDGAAASRSSMEEEGTPDSEASQAASPQSIQTANLQPMGSQYLGRGPETISQQSVGPQNFSPQTLNQQMDSEALAIPSLKPNQTEQPESYRRCQALVCSQSQRVEETREFHTRDQRLTAANVASLTRTTSSRGLSWPNQVSIGRPLSRTAETNVGGSPADLVSEACTSQAPKSKNFLGRESSPQRPMVARQPDDPALVGYARENSVPSQRVAEQKAGSLMWQQADPMRDDMAFRSECALNPSAVQPGTVMQDEAEFLQPASPSVARTGERSPLTDVSSCSAISLPLCQHHRGQPASCSTEFECPVCRSMALFEQLIRCELQLLEAEQTGDCSIGNFEHCLRLTRCLIRYTCVRDQ